MLLKPSTPATLLQTLITKVKQFRQVFTQCGYSQHEFQEYFLSNILHYQVKSTQNITKSLTQQLMSLNTVDKIENLLGSIDQQINGLLMMYDDKENNQVGNKIEGEQNQKKEDNLKKRKSSKQQKQIKKQKRSKGQKTRRQKEPSSKCIPKQMVQNKEAEAFQKLFNKKTEQANIFKTFFKQPLTQMPIDSYQNREARQKQLIYQKLIEIQMLSKLMCPDSQNIMFGQRILNPFARIC